MIHPRYLFFRFSRFGSNPVFTISSDLIQKGAGEIITPGNR